MDELHRLRRSSRLLLAAQVVVLGLTLIPLLTRTSVAEENLVAGTIQAKALVITDDDGNAAAVLGLSEGEPILTLKAPDGVGRVSLYARNEGNSALLLNGTDSQLTLDTKGGQPGLRAYSEKKTRIALAVDDEGAGLTLDGKDK